MSASPVVTDASGTANGRTVELTPRTEASPTKAGAPEDPGCGVGLEPPLRPQDAARQAGILKAVADPQRLRLLSLLAAQPDDGALCVCDIESSFDLSQPTISHHLKVLRAARLVTVTKRGLWHYYAIDRSAIAALQDTLAHLSARRQPLRPSPVTPR